MIPILMLLAASAVSLFDGKTLKGWVNEGGANFRAVKGEIVVDKGPYSWLRSENSYKDYELTLEFKTGAEGNSGVFLRSSVTGKPHETGYELQIFDGHKEFPTGSIVGVAKATPAKLLPDVWNSYDIIHVGDKITVKLNGKKVLDAKDSRSKSGHIGLQFNPDKPIAFRKIKIKEL